MKLYAGYKKYSALRRHEKMLFLEAFFCQLWAGLIIKIIPFRYTPVLYAAKLRGSGFMVHGDTNSGQEVIGEVKKAIERAGIISPWKNRCLVESLAARRMLNRRRIPSQISLGVALDENKELIAHAWIRAGDTQIVSEGGDYREMYLF